MKKIYLDIIERMKEISQSSTDSDLAMLLGVQKSSISAYKNRGIPKDKLIIFSQKYNVDLNWLENGESNNGFDSVRVINLHDSEATNTVRVEIYVDVAENYFSADGLYVFTFDDHTFIKRLQKRGRKMWAMSDNKEKYEPWQIHTDDPIYIHGRVVFSLPMKMKKW